MTEDAQWYVRTCGPGTVTLQQMQESATGDLHRIINHLIITIMKKSIFS